MEILGRILQRLALRFRSGAALRRALVLILGVAAVAFLVLNSRLSLVSIPGAPATHGIETSPPAVAATPGTVEATIQSVILRGNQQQERAIFTRSVATMRDTSSDRYFQEMAAINQEMLDGGVTNIKLLKIEWGEIKVDGNTATATTWETWSTEFSDGSTEQSGRERNVYKLLRVNNGWVIDADEHPDQGGPGFPGLPNPFGGR